MIEVSYIDHMNSDLSVANTARVSFDKETNWEEGHDADGPYYFLKDRDKRLINFLAREKHLLPFRHPQIQLHIKAPIFVFRQLDKHQVGFSTSEISRRYVTGEPEFFEPEYWRQAAPDKKQGSIDTPVEGLEGALHGRLNQVYGDVLDLYEALLGASVAPEMARIVLPQAMMTQQIKTGSLLGWHHLYKLRSSPDAQKEIRIVAEQIKEIVEQLFPVSWKALEENQ